MDRIEHGTLLWKPPFVQLSRPFAQGDTLGALVEEGLLHPQTPPIFRADPDDASSPPVRLYKHQSDAIRAILVGQGANTVVATGAAVDTPLLCQAWFDEAQESRRQRDEALPFEPSDRGRDKLFKT